MSKISLENKKGKYIITNKLSYPEAINERVYHALATGVFEGFLPVSVSKKKKETIIECTAQGLMPLSQYFGGVVTKKMFLDVAHNVAGLIKNCEKNMINANNMELQMDKIFVHPQTKKIQCIFWPIVNNQRESPPHVFLKQLPWQLQHSPYEDNSYLEKYNAFFNGGTPFSVNNFDRMVLSLLGQDLGQSHRIPSESLQGEKNLLEKSDPSIPKKENIAYDPFANDQKDMNEKKSINSEFCNEDYKYCAFCGAKNRPNANFCTSCGHSLNEKKSEKKPEPKGTVVLGDAFGDTTVLDFNPFDKPAFPKLTRLRTGDIFEVNKPNYRIGSEQKYCDLFIQDNNYISRSHADIVSREGRYYVIDRNSTNRTYVDGRVIPIEKEVEIFDGTKLRLADEDFVFHI